MKDSRSPHGAEDRVAADGRRSPPNAKAHDMSEVFHADVDAASESSFPASDPPAWMGMPPGGPPRTRAAEGAEGKAEPRSLDPDLPA